MNPDSEDFDSLRQLLALKRHEVPPPGYFDRLSRDVMARIKAGEQGGQVGADFSWFQRLLSMFDVKPVFAGAFGTAVCAFLISGVISSEQTPVMNAGAAPRPDTARLAEAPVGESNASIEQLMASTTNAGGSGSLFDQFNLETRNVSYLQGNN
jgi:hypothetical protein